MDDLNLKSTGTGGSIFYVLRAEFIDGIIGIPVPETFLNSCKECSQTRLKLFK